MPTYGPNDYLELGSWNVTCYRCTKKYKASEMMRYWEGYWVCPRCWEPRQPQDYLKPVPDITSVPFSQGPAVLIPAAFCTPNGLSAIPGYAEPGCLVPGYLSPIFNSEGDPF